MLANAALRAQLPALLLRALSQARGELAQNSMLFSTKEDFAYAVLRWAILSGALTPGTHLVTRTLAEALGTSPIPVRTALHRLAAEGLVSIRTHAGAFVTDLPFDRLVQILEVRQAVEELAARRAATRITEAQVGELRKLMESLELAVKKEDWQSFARLNRAFHSKIHGAAGSPPLLEVLDRLLSLSERAQAVFAMDLSRARQSQREHTQLLEALAERKPDLAAEAARRHRQASIETLRHLSMKKEGGIQCDRVAPRSSSRICL